MPEATLTTGVTLRYAAQGDPAGVPVVLLHGLTDSHPSYAPMTDHLPEHIRAYTLTTRGHGDSDKPEHGYGLEHQAADVAAFMDAVGVDAAVIVGHSMGSYIAQRFAIDHPERTIALVLMGTFKIIAGHADLVEFRAELDEIEDPVPTELAREFQESTIARQLAPGQLEQAIAESCKVPAHVWRAGLQGLLDAAAPTDTGQITAPTRILWGDRDQFTSHDEQLRLLDAIPGAELLVYEGTGHALHWEEPARAAADIAAFIAPRGPRRPRLAVAR